MSADKFLELDIKRLFEEHAIRDIELIQKQVQHESDRKKIELRTLVGERYRDLIQAADSIAEMKQTSESVLSKILNIEETFHDLQQKYLIGFKMETDRMSVPRLSSSSSVSDSVVIQIKILMDIPEQIWSAIDENNFLLATQLFLLAQHINYSLSFEVGDADLAKKYPLVSKQWGIINQFKSLILNFCNDALHSVELSKEVAANCLAALVLLDGLNLSDLLSRLISFRSETIQSIVVSESDLSVKNKIKLCLNVMMETILLISYCFIKCGDSRDGLVEEYVNDIKDKDAAYMLSQLDLDKELLNKFLPLVAKSHKPFVPYELQKLSLSQVQECVKKWFEWIKNLTSQKVAKLLNLITSIKGVHSIREDCLAVNIPDDWNSVWEQLSMPSVNFWFEFFHPLITERVKCILNDKIASCLSDLETRMIELLKKATNESRPENDLRWFVWKESASDIPQKLIEGSSCDNKRPLLLKARGFSPNISELCENFESCLSEILSHLKQYLYETDQMPSMKDDLLSADIYSTKNKFCDRLEIQSYLQVISENLVDDFVKFIKQECIVENPRIGRQDVNAILAARFLQALPLLCSNLKECFTISRPTGVTLTNIKWQEICDKMKRESIAIWSAWAAKCFAKTISRSRENCLIKDENELRVHVVVTDWEKVTIEEEAEGKRIKSEILVPYQPSVHLQKFLASVCRDLNKVVPHTIPKLVLNEIIDDIVAELLDYYGSVSASAQLRQKQAIQMLFDVKFASLLMVPRDSKSLFERSSKVCNGYIAKIDPFDFDVFYPFINANVKKAVQRSLLIYGNLVPHVEQLHSVLGARIEHGEGLKSAKDPPGVVALCTGAPWFPPLAVAAPANLAAAPVPVQQKRKQAGAREQHTRNDSTGSSIKSGAAAFFGAMGSDWFGTS